MIEIFRILKEMKQDQKHESNTRQDKTNHITPMKNDENHMIVSGDNNEKLLSRNDQNTENGAITKEDVDKKIELSKYIVVDSPSYND
jgi:hypothetical protein